MEFNASNTFCISLTPERWERMQKRLGTLKLDCTRWQASTPETLEDNFAPYLNPRQKACAQSHIRIWRHMVARDLPAALILEDDAMFARDWRESLQRLPPDPHWNAIFLNASEEANPRNTWVPAREQYLTGAYVLSLAGAKWLLTTFGREFAASDWMTTRLQCGAGHCYTYFPWLVIQEGLESTIGSGVAADHAKVLRLLGNDIANYI